MSAETPPFELDGVSVRWGTHCVLQDLTLRIESGEVMGLVGPSGAGKTTLLRILAGALPTTEGTVRIHGREWAGLSSREKRRLRATMGFIHQDLALVPNLRVAQNVLSGRLGRQGFIASLRALIRPSREALEEVFAILQRVGIGDKIFQRTDRLSGGEQQRVAIARALYQEPQALLADEPVSSVDPSRAQDTLALLVEISRERGVPLILSLHQPHLARRSLDRLIGLREGRLFFDRPACEVGDEDFAHLYRLNSVE